MSLRVTILGCGSSGGVPRVGKEGWGACDPNEPKNRRRRCSIMVQRFLPDCDPTNVLVDVSPDLRTQLLDAQITRLDGILLTHPHADHLHGIDDVRPLVLEMRKRLDIYMDAYTSHVAGNAFSYIFKTPAGSMYPPLLNDTRLEPGVECAISGPSGAVRAIPIVLNHGEINALGFRFGNIAYSPDVKDIPEESVVFFENLDVWIIDALRYKSHPSHFSLDDALAWIARMKPKRAVLTNLHTDLDYAALRAKLPAHIDLAYDGMVIDAPIP